MEKDRSDRRLKVLEMSRVDIHKPVVKNRELLPDTPCVIATTHISDIDVQEIASIIGEDRKIGVSSLSTNLTFPLFAPFVNAVGRENLFPISNTIKHGGKFSFSLNIEDIEKMKKGITDEGRTMIVAAHNRTQGWKLPEDPGLAAVVLAHVANVPLVPVALDIHSESPIGMAGDILGRATTITKNLLLRKRPHARVSICDPIQPLDISHESIIAAVSLYSIEKRKMMSKEDIDQAKLTLNILKTEARQVMHSLAEKLPYEKRGIWDKAQNKDSRYQI